MANIGLDGNDAPDTVNGLPWLTWIGLQSRLNTLRGKELLDPDYGVDLRPYVSTIGGRVGITEAMRVGLIGLENVHSLRFTPILEDGLDVQVVVDV